LCRHQREVAIDKLKKITKLASDYGKGYQTNIIQSTASQNLLGTMKMVLDLAMQN
jgi:hypothetical protein